jgi:hypothetical protein
LPLQFNIIYVPGTVKLLTLFVFSLLEWSDCSFRLVSNGCLPEEIDLLRRLCSTTRRLEYLALPFEKVVEHGQALSYLQSLEHSDHFCFIDSDILATGDFLDQFVPLLEQYAGVFSCSSICFRDQEKILLESSLQIFGRHHVTEQGMCLGSTYFAIYNNPTLAQVIQSTRIGFARYRWSDIPPHHQASLTAIGLERKSYDTGKLLNLVLLIRGERTIFLETPALQHIGGMSVTNIPSCKLHSVLIASAFRRLVRRLVGKLNPASGTVASPRAENLSEGERRRRRATITHYFRHLIKALLEKQAIPAKPTLDDAEIEVKVGWITTHIIELYQRNEKTIDRLYL